MSKRRYANETSVGVGSSRNDIQKVLEQFGATQLQWSDDFKNGISMIRFLWEHEGATYCARFEIAAQTDAQMREDAKDGRNGNFSQSKYDTLRKRRGMVEHRELYLFIKALMVAVEAGIVKAEAVLLPFLEDKTGQTVADQVLPHLKKLHTGSALRLMERNP